MSAAPPGRRAWVVEIGLIVAAAVVIPLAAFAVVPGVRDWVVPFTVAWLVVFVLAVGVSGGYARHDPRGYLSLAAPTMAMTVLGLGAYVIDSRSIAVTACFLAAIGWSTLFLLAVKYFWASWSRIVLRRPWPSRAYLFDGEIRRYVTLAGTSVADAIRQPPDGRLLLLRRATVAIDELRRLPAPDAAWATVRDDLCDGQQALAEAARRRPLGDDWDAALARSEAAAERLDALRRRDGLIG